MRALFHAITGGSLAGRLFCMKLNMLIYRGLHQKRGCGWVWGGAVKSGCANSNASSHLSHSANECKHAQRLRQNCNGCPLRARVMKTNRSYGGSSVPTSCVPRDLTLSLLRLVLLPGYYFLWQHLSRRGEQRWKDPDRWLLCILWTGSPFHICVRDVQFDHSLV